MKVLVVDDDLGSRLVATAAVQRIGHECISAPDGFAAWDLWQSDRPDVVISDRMMPGRDGLELTRLIRGAQQDFYTYIVLLTSADGRDDMVTGLQAGADDYIVKPLDPLTLGARLLVAERVTALHRDLGVSRAQAQQQLESSQELAEQRATLLAEAVFNAHQLKDSESRLRDAAQLTRGVLNAVTEQSVIGTDLDGFIDVWNPGAVALLALPESEALYRRHITDFHKRTELAEIRDGSAPVSPTPAGSNGFDSLARSAREGIPEVRRWTYVRADGTEVPVEVAVTPRVDDDGVTVGYIFVGTDVTKAQEVARLKDEFVGLISHEIRTPLTSISGYIELMLDDEEEPPSASQRAYLGVLMRNAERLLRLAGDLLFIAQDDAGAFSIVTDEVNLVAVASAAAESASPAAITAGITLAVDFPELPIMMLGDAARLGQACDNLISNAIKYTPRGGNVTVTMRPAEAEAVLSVRDTGMGIPAAEFEQLYTQFFRASTAKLGAVQGIGLGLTITKAIITAHGGRLDVRSEVGAGTEFIMSLPLAGANQDEGLQDEALQSD